MEQISEFKLTKSLCNLDIWPLKALNCLVKFFMTITNRVDCLAMVRGLMGYINIRIALFKQIFVSFFYCVFSKNLIVF